MTSWLNWNPLLLWGVGRNPKPQSMQQTKKERNKKKGTEKNIRNPSTSLLTLNHHQRCLSVCMSVCLLCPFAHLQGVVVRDLNVAWAANNISRIVFEWVERTLLWQLQLLLDIEHNCRAYCLACFLIVCTFYARNRSTIISAAKGSSIIVILITDINTLLIIQPCPNHAQPLWFSALVNSICFGFDYFWVPWPFLGKTKQLARLMTNRWCRWRRWYYTTPQMKFLNDEEAQKERKGVKNPGILFVVSLVIWFDY